MFYEITQAFYGIGVNGFNVSGHGFFLFHTKIESGN